MRKHKINNSGYTSPALLFSKNHPQEAHSQKTHSTSRNFQKAALENSRYFRIGLLNKHSYSVIVLISCLLMNSVLWAQSIQYKSDEFVEINTAAEVKAMAPAGSYSNQLKVTAIPEWEIDMTSSDAWRTNYKFKQVVNYVKVAVDQSILKNNIANYKYQFHFILTGYKKGTDTNLKEIIPFTLTLEYNKDSLQAYQHQSIIRFSKDKFYRFRTELVNIVNLTTGIPATITKANLADNFYIETGILTQKIDLKDYNTRTLRAGSEYLTDSRELEVFWNHHTGGTCPTKLTEDKYKPAMYELEWTYIDDYRYNLSTGVKSYAFTPSSYNINYKFTNNATRVQTDKLSYKIPIVYEHGALVFRVRAIFPDSANFSNVRYGAWTLADVGSMTQSTSGCKEGRVYIINKAHHSDSVNWQYSINFAEEGKYKHIVSYFDGIGKNRQTQTKIQTDNDYVIGVDNIYDYEGRAAIKTLPTPIISSNLDFKSNITLHAGSGTSYKASNFDLGCTNDSIAPLHSTSLANIYYSASNPDKSFMQKFVPDAHGYPFIETIYSADNTNKVIWQGGAGRDFQRWNNRGTRFLYGRANSVELNTLMGSEVGYSTYYPKQVTIDPNGQSSYSIFNNRGQVVATALMGDSPDSTQYPISKLSHYENPTTITYDILKNLTQNISKSKRIAEHTFIAEAGSANKLKYGIHIPPFNTDCASKYIHLKGIADIKAVSECGSIVWSNSYTAGSIAVNTSSTPQNISFPEATFTLTPDKYTFIKTLSFPDTMMGRVADEFVTNNTGLTGTCYINEDIFVQHSIDNTDFPCDTEEEDTDCERARKNMLADLYPNAKYGKYLADSEGGFIDGVSNSIFTKVSYGGIESYCNYTLSNSWCGIPDPDLPAGLPCGCGPNIWTATAPNPIPGGVSAGEYFNSSGISGIPCDISILEGPYDCYTPTQIYRYQDDCIGNITLHIKKTLIVSGEETTIYLLKPLKSVSPQELIDNFTEAVAEILLPLHPEYCKLAACDTGDFVTRLENISSYKEAEVLGMNNLSSILANDPLNNSVKPTAPFTATELSYYPISSTFIKRIDTLSLEMAYCGSNAKEATLYCIEKQYRNKIKTFTLPDWLQDTYFDNLRNNYLMARSVRVQKMMDGTSNSCEPCAAKRMTVIAPPEFPVFFNPGGTAISDDAGLPAWWKDIYNDALDGSLTTGSTIPPGLESEMSNADMESCEAQIDAIIRDMVNCGMTPIQKTAFQTSLLQYCKPGTAGSIISPNIVKTLLDSLSVPMNEMCHSFLAKYNIYGTRNKKLDQGFFPKSPEYYTGLETFINRVEVKNALLYATTAGYSAGTITINPATNAFEKTLAESLSLPSSGGTVTLKGFVSDVTISTGTRQYYKLSLANGTTESDTLFFSPRAVSHPHALDDAPGGLFSYIANLSTLNNPSASSTTIEFNKLKNIYEDGADMGIAPGHISNNLVYAILKKNATIPSTPFNLIISQYSFYNIWGHRVSMMDKVDTDIPQNCATCPELQKALDDFIITDKTAYKYDIYSNSPLFKRTLSNYLNYKWGRQHTFEEYEALMNGCAISDKVVFPKFRSSLMATFTSLPSIHTFVSNMNANLDTIRVPYHVIKKGSTFYVDFDMNGVPYNKYRTVKQYLTTASGPSSRTYQNIATDNIVLHTQGISPLPSISGATVGSNDIQILSADGSMQSGMEIVINTSSIDPKVIADLTHAVNEFIKSTPACIPAKTYYKNELYRSSDYATPAKQQYLTYAYSLYGQHPFKIRNALGASLVKDNVAALSASTIKLSYQDPECHSVQNHLYHYNEVQASFSGFDTLNKILNAVKSGLGSNKLFSETVESSITPTGLGSGSFLKLKAYKQADGGMWYRFFNSSNKLKNVYLYPTAKMAYKPSEYTMVAGSLKLLGNADSLYQFTVRMTKSGHTISCVGYTDFPIGVGGKLEHVVLYDHQGQMNCSNTYTCESELLDRAIEQGKEAYAVYRDSIVQSLHDGMAMHFPKNSVDTLKHTTAKQQYHHTLYYYDLAGNLTRTVPPQGVNPLPLASMDAIDNARQSGAITQKAAHNKISSYRYNSANQIIWQQTPDGGITRFFYDKAGRLAYSQNDKQKVDNKFSYTLYDQQGRICETGVLLVDNLVDTTTYIKNAGKHLMSKGTVTGEWIFGRLREDVVATRYDYQLLNLHEIDDYKDLPEQQNLRKRVAAVMYSTKVAGENNIENYYDYATHFTYDAMGNVATLVHDNPYMNYMGQRFKKVDYDYDLLSGKVNMLSYNRGHTDQYYQKYEYDADNRIVRVMTSSDGLLWDRDADYEYYKHGPLAKVTTGSLNVQQTEYAYTIQGWLKAINGDALNPADDMGAGMNGTGMPPDVFVHALDYYKDDYKPIGTTQVMHKSTGDVLTRSLYNGNIARQTTGMTTMANLQRDYSYDQLHRITKTQYSAYDNIAHTVTSLGNAYRNTYTYDKDGNIHTLTRRNITGTLIDSFTYHYTNPIANNKLGYVQDYVTSSTGNDLKSGQTVGNYTYDPLGNLITDNQEGIKDIRWNAYGKMTELYKGTTSTDTMSMKFSYDAMGYRVRKDYIQPLPDDKFSVLSDIYVRDASGNVLAVYKEKAILGGSMSIEWLIEDVVDGTGGWSVASSNPFSISRFLVESFGVAGPFITSISTRPEILDLSWSNSWVNTKSTGFYLHYAPSIRSKAGLAVIQPQLHNAFNWFKTSHLSLMTDVLLADSIAATQQLLQPYWNMQHNNGYTNYSYFFTHSPALSDHVLNHYGIDPSGMSIQDKVIAMDNVVAEHGFQQIWSQITQDFHPEYDASGYLEALLTDTAIFSTYNLQQNQQMRQSLLAAFSYPKAEYKTDFFNTLGGWIDGVAPTFLLQNASISERLRAIYDFDKVDYVKTFGQKFGTAEVANIVKGIPGVNLMSFRKIITWAIGKTISPSYDPPEIHDPSPENMIADTLYLAEHHLYGSSRLGIKQYADSLYYTVYGTDDTLLNVPTDWYSYTYADWMQKNKASAYINNEYSVSSDTASSLNRLGTKQYEFSDHLGNVLVTILDKRSGTGNAGGNYTGWLANVSAVNDYYPYGMLMEERSAEHKNYRFSHNTQEKTDEIAGKGNHHTAQFWEYSPRIARRWNVDPVDQISISNYSVNGLNPIANSDPNGDNWIKNKENGEYKWDNNVSNAKNTPSGFKYIGEDDYSIVDDMFPKRSYGDNAQEFSLVSPENFENPYSAKGYAMVHTNIFSKMVINISPMVETIYSDNGEIISKEFTGLKMTTTISSYISPSFIGVKEKFGNGKLFVNGSDFSYTLNSNEEKTFYNRFLKRNVTYKAPTIRDSKTPINTAFLHSVVTFSNKELLKFKNNNIKFNFKFEGNLYNKSKPFSIPTILGMSNTPNTIRMNVNFKTR